MNSFEFEVDLGLELFSFSRMTPPPKAIPDHNQTDPCRICSDSTWPFVAILLFQRPSPRSSGPKMVLIVLLPQFGP